MKQFYRKYLEQHGVTFEVSAFQGTENGLTEYHAMLRVDARGETFPSQCRRLHDALLLALDEQMLADAEIVVGRYFLSDSTNQLPVIMQTIYSQEEYARLHSCRSSIAAIQQSPLDGSKIAMWVYLVSGTDVEHSLTGNIHSVRHNGYNHLWLMGANGKGTSSYAQTAHILEVYSQQLEQTSADAITIAGNCVRTWFYVRDVDTNYKGLVLARREYFDYIGLTADTHYIASTGIGGSPATTNALVQMDAYTVGGLKPEQTQYLYARTHLNPTYEYNVTFERGSRIAYGDRNHVFISGTASINNKGEVVHSGDVVLQTKRMWENVEALLSEAGASFDDMMHVIVYLRDVADYQIVEQMFRERFPDVPRVITLAPVCRPTWLIEMECMAVTEARNPEFNPL